MYLQRTFLFFIAGTAMVGLSQAQDVRTTLTIEEPQVREMVITEGYDDPITIEREENLWRVKSTESGSNEEIVLFVDNDGNVLSASEVTTMRISQDASGFEETDQHEIVGPLVTDITRARRRLRKQFLKLVKILRGKPARAGVRQRRKIRLRTHTRPGGKTRQQGKLATSDNFRMRRQHLLEQCRA